MRFERNVNLGRLPDDPDLAREMESWFRLEGGDVKLRQMPWNEIGLLSKTQRILGLPQYFAVRPTGKGGLIRIWPRPSRVMIIHFAYWPKRRVV